MGLVQPFSLGKGRLQSVRRQKLSPWPALGKENSVWWSYRVQCLHIRGWQASHGPLQIVVLGSRHEVCVIFLQGRSPGRVQKADSPPDCPGLWAGTVYHTSGGGIIATVSQEKWKKTQSLVRELVVAVQEAAVVQEQECETAGVAWQQMMESEGFNKKAKLPRELYKYRMQHE